MNDFQRYQPECRLSFEALSGAGKAVFSSTQGIRPEHSEIIAGVSRLRLASPDPAGLVF